MFVDKSGEKSSSHRLAEMDKLITSCLAECRHCFCCYDDDLAIWIHAQSLANVDECINIGSHAVEQCLIDNDLHDLRNLYSYHLRVFWLVAHHLGLLLGNRFHFLRKVIDAFQIVGVESLDKDWEEIGNAHGEVIAAAEELLYKQSRKLPRFLNLVSQTLEQNLLNIRQYLLIYTIWRLIFSEHKYLVELDQTKLTLLSILHVVDVHEVTVNKLEQVLHIIPGELDVKFLLLRLFTI